MKFEDHFIATKDRFSVGQESDTGKYFVSIPVSNGMVEYNEYYEISREEFDAFTLVLSPMKALVEKCRERTNDANLIIQPGAKRGVAV